MGKQQYWFVRQPRGWGWKSVSWQGYLVLGAYSGTLMATFLNTGDNFDAFLVRSVALTLVLWLITYWKTSRAQI
jgi:hypothetical protein